MSIPWRRLRLSTWGQRLIVAALLTAVLLPLLDRLPRVAVVACFDAGHPLYSLVPASPDGVHCLTAPEPLVSWTLMVAAALVAQLVLVPAALLVTAGLLAGARRLIGIGRGVLAAALAQLGPIVPAWPQPAPVPVPVRATSPGWSRVHPHRGPPRS